MTPSPKVAVIGAGPAGIYASDLLVRGGATVDLFERMPAPFGLIRYGVAPDHPRIKGIVTSLHKVLDRPEIRLIGNVNVGQDITVAELAELYDAVVFSTGAVDDRELDIPGVELPESYGAAEFVGFYDGNPLFERSWDLSASSVAVIGVGNVGLDVARILAKTGEELHVTEIPDNVYEVLRGNKATEVHIFGRRGPAQAKFTPQELKELDHSPNVNVVVSPEDIDYDEASLKARAASKSVDLVCQILEGYAIREPKDAPHTLHIHLFEQPVSILASDDGHVAGVRTERQELDGTGGVRGTGKFTDWPVGSVYRAVGYRSVKIPGVPFSEEDHVIPNDGGHVLAEDGHVIPGFYATGWIKRGPVGLIGNTKSDAKETTDMLLADFAEGRLQRQNFADVYDVLKAKGVETTSWEGWYALDAAERALGEPEGRERKKLVEWEDMLAASR